ncbi:MAG: orotidine-5'-phosphate decarboxylase [Firmicutes bacterium]|nr:orotidine-5'-phosphate decarboxylase [Bacillota bacterium]
MSRPEGIYNPIIAALDVNTFDEAQALFEKLNPLIDFYKIGMELFTAVGPKIVEHIKARGGKVFLDLKYHDIPNSVEKAVAAAAALEVDMLTIHAGGGKAMLEAAAKGTGGRNTPILLGVTVLTSIDDAVLRSELRVPTSVQKHVNHMAQLTVASGLQGVVASPLEIANLRRVLGDKPVIVTPGIRPLRREEKVQADDQKRFATPTEAVAAGADYLVIGRPITQAPDPVEAAYKITQDLKKK